MIDNIVVPSTLLDNEEHEEETRDKQIAYIKALKSKYFEYLSFLTFVIFQQLFLLVKTVEAERAIAASDERIKQLRELEHRYF